jgi:hypothetical protein
MVTPPMKDVLYFVFMAGILALGLPALWSGLDTGADLKDGSVTTVVDISGSKANRRPVIEVAGQRYACHTIGVASFDKRVRYNASDPERCRLEEEVGQREWFQVVLGLFFTTIAAYGFWVGVGMVRGQDDADT